MPFPLVPPARRLIALSGSALVFVVVAWTLTWFYGAIKFQSFVRDWVKAQNVNGATLVYKETHREGFPFAIRLQLKNIAWNDGKGGAIATEALTLSARPWLWSAFTFATTAPVTVTWPWPDQPEPYAITIAAAEGSVAPTHGIRWGRIAFTMHNWTLRHGASDLFAAAQTSVTLANPAEEPRDHTMPGLSIMLSANDLTVATDTVLPFGTKVASATVAFRIMGTPPDFLQRASVADWNKESGIIEFDQMDMRWGPLDMTMRGTMGFDDDLQPEGAFSGRLGGREAVVKSLIDRGWVAKRNAAMLNSAINLFSKPLKDSGDIEVPVTVQMGGVFLGPVRVAVFPDLIWPGTQQPPQP